MVQEKKKLKDLFNSKNNISNSKRMKPFCPFTYSETS